MHSSHLASGHNTVEESPLGAWCLMMSANYHAVDHLQSVKHRSALVQGAHDIPPWTRQCPAQELAIDARPFTEFLG